MIKFITNPWNLRAQMHRRHNELLLYTQNNKNAKSHPELLGNENKVAQRHRSFSIIIKSCRLQVYSACFALFQLRHLMVIPVSPVATSVFRVYIAAKLGSVHNEECCMSLIWLYVILCVIRPDSRKPQHTDRNTDENYQHPV